MIETERNTENEAIETQNSTQVHRGRRTYRHTENLGRKGEIREMKINELLAL